MRSVLSRFFNTKRDVITAFASLLVLGSCATAPVSIEEPPGRLDSAALLMDEGDDYTEKMELSAARESYVLALSEYASLDNREGTVQSLLSLGWNAWQEGDPAAADEFYYHASELSEVSGDIYLIMDVSNHQADLALRLGDPVEAVSILESNQIDSSARVELARKRIYATALDSLGETDEALLLLKAAVDGAKTSDELNELAQSAYRLAVIYSRLAAFDDARFWADKALEADRSAEYPPGIAVDLRALAIIAVRSGDDTAAEDYYRRSWLAYLGMGREGDADESARELETLTGRRVFLPE